MKRITRSLASLLFVGWAGIANAIPIEWTLQNAAFNDQATATGSFIFDATLSQYSSVNIDVSAGALPSSTMLFISGGITATASQVLFAAASPQIAGTQAFALFFSSLLTDAGGIVGIANATQAPCSAPGCPGPGTPQRFLVSGEVSGTSVPLPATIALFGVGLAGLGWSRRKKA
jgi:PEP-CTERM motif-containing protein